MGKKKITVDSSKTLELVHRQQEVDTLLKQAVEEDKAKLVSVEKQIREICEKNNVFCGVVLNIQDLLAVTELMYQSHEPVSIEFRVMFKEE